MSHVKLTDCAFSWDRSQRPFLFSGINLNLEPGSWTLLRGPSGSGKSTLALVCAGILHPVEGTVRFDGRRSPRRRSVQFLFQDPIAAMNPLMTVGQWFERVVGIRWKRSGMTDGLASIFERLGLNQSLMPARPLELSGGECQRINLAAAISAAPTILILDEPFTMVDEDSRAVMLDMLTREVSDRRTALLLVHHRDLPKITPIDQTLELSGGSLVPVDHEDDAAPLA